MTSFTVLQPENWLEPRKILVVLAHPDDPEFFCGGTLLRWIHAGHEVEYLLLTNGDKGSQDLTQSPKDLIALRQNEQKKAAALIGASRITFLDEPDGFLQLTDNIRKAVVRKIREVCPHIIVSSDPLTYYFREIYINHPDHKMAGEITLSAVFPAAGNPFYYPDLIQQEGLEPHTPDEVWLAMPEKANVSLDITPEWKEKISALHAHASQIGDPAIFDRNMLSRRVEGSSEESPRFEEHFRRLFKR